MLESKCHNINLLIPKRYCLEAKIFSYGKSKDSAIADEERLEN